uniref:Uncharacterized protein n=1 Tax=Meloidogyne incognita TaxID=6306 RepID=A0A914MSW0_MELIC
MISDIRLLSHFRLQEKAANCLIARLNESKLEGCDHVHASFIPKFGIACSPVLNALLPGNSVDELKAAKDLILVEMARLSVEVMVVGRMILMMILHLIEIVGMETKKLELRLTLSNAKDVEQKKSTLNLWQLIQVLLSLNMEKTMGNNYIQVE